jgi:hypothetical protein
MPVEIYVKTGCGEVLYAVTAEPLRVIRGKQKILPSRIAVGAHLCPD